MNKLDALPNILLLGPGPSGTHPEVYRALTSPTLGHLDPVFISLMDELKGMLQQLTHTRNEVTFPVSGTGSAGMEAGFVNFIEPGDSVLVLINGVFGMRMKDVAERLGARVDSLEFDWGTPVDPEAVKARLATRSYDLVAVVHAETSTGVRNPLDEIAPLVRASGALFLVDSVTGLGGIPVTLDDWGVDVFYSGTQKCLACPPGLAPFSASPRAIKRLQNRRGKVPNWYLDLSMIVNYWAGEKRAYHHTAPINMIYGLHAAVRVILEEGEDAVIARHQSAHEALVTGLEDLGLELLVAPGHRLPMLNAVKVPEGVDEAGVRAAMLRDHGIEFGAGLGPLAGKIWRIGLMGHNARPEVVSRCLEALGACL
ncbi:MAG: alanine--glyoxylate aminotransferase family protein [Verrucomicrobia bacterium]|nr:alanine--glyoxylate aminotransferase family protein [Verrucomicrobiota bacterium]MCH8510829.1 alanine--glyoxylate aminotransferase family protein [Kiritimatiellia bacterium]